MTALLATLAVLAAAPALDRALPERTAGPFDAVLRVAVVALLLVDVLPEAVAVAGWGAFVAAIAGVGAVFVGHRLGLDADTAGRAGAAALAAHGFADGIALGVARGTALGLVVALHTAPLALATWRLGSAALGRPVAAGLLAASGLGTVAGYAAGATWAGTQSVAWIAALTSGMLLAAAAHGSPNR